MSTYMHQSDSYKNQRQTQRVPVNLTIKMSFGTQVTLTGRIKDLSLKSAFILVKSSVHMDMNDEISFVIEHPSDSSQQGVQGQARISRVAAGEGIAIYFIKLDEASMNLLKQWVL
ncbi:MAG: PilZ domain-containing protein [Candidatus Omnitrophica bacterium]|nr:PilZ domain-containing protein [Candidatus Omnitrophota bacterium]